MLTIEKKSVQPVYQQIKNSLREKIVSGELIEGAAIPDERAFAAQLSISRMTVRRAIVELTQEGLLQRVRGKGTFVRGSCTPRKRVRRISVGILRGPNPYPWLNEPLDLFCYRMLHGISKGCAQAELLLSHYEVTLPIDATVAALRAEKMLKGLIAFGIADAAILRGLRLLSIPVVLLDSVQPEDGAIFDEVNHAGEPAVHDAVTHLLRLGHRRIGLMQSNAINAVNRQRQDGYERALKSFDVPVRKELIFPVCVSSDSAYAAMRQILNGPDLPSALFCSGDQLAVGALAAIAEQGLKVPRDISVVGYGDEGYFTAPRLSSVRVPLEQMGMKAVEVLAERLKHPAAPLKRILLPTEYIPRGTCERPAK